MGLVYNTTTGRVEYLVDLEGGSNGPITINFAYMQDTQPSNPQEKDVWFDTANNKIYTYKNGQWVESDPQVGVFYLYNDEYYLWDGNSLEKTDLNIYEKIENKTDNFTEDNSIKYPSSKALSDGLKSVEPNLYDIRTLSQAVVDKGWALICKDTRQNLAKVDVPTVYEDILTKYNNANAHASENVTNLNIWCAKTSVDISNGYLYGTSNSNNKYLQKISLSNLQGTWETLNSTYKVAANSNYHNGLAVGDNLIVYFGLDGSNNNQYNIFAVKKSDGTLVEKKDLGWRSGQSSPVDDSHDLSVYLLKTNSGNKFIISYAIDNRDNTKQRFIAIMDDNVNATIVDKITNATYSLFRPIYLENENKIMFQYYSESKIYKADLDFQNWTVVKENVGGSYGEGYNLYKIGNTILAAQSVGSYCSTDGGATWSSGHATLYGWCNGEVFYGVNRDRNLYTSTDLVNFTNLKNTGVYSLKTVYDETTQTTVMQYETTVYYLGMVKTQYTDTINGSTVTYYKYDDYKICLKDGGTNDAALANVYNYMGYYNYFVLDIAGEKVSLPRNSNLYSMMYVGDNYQDTLDGIVGNITRFLPQSNVVEDTTSTAISFSSSNQVQPNTDYQYGTLATLTFGSSSVNYSLLGTTIMFTSGATATEITDSASIDWVDGASPEPSASKTCLIFIWKNKGFYKEW